MKHLKKFNESFESILPELVTWIKDEYKDCEIQDIVNINNSIDFELIGCDVEPEVGSYVNRSSFNIKVTEKGSKYNLEIYGISGEYGCDDEDEDFCEPEMDWDISASKIEKTVKDLDFESVKNVIKDTLNEYI